MRRGRSACVEGAVHASEARLAPSETVPCTARIAPPAQRLGGQDRTRNGLPPTARSRLTAAMAIANDQLVETHALTANTGTDLLHSRFAPPSSGNWLSEATYGETAASIGLETLHSPLPSSIPILPFFNNGPNDQLFLAQGCRSAGQYCLLYWATL